MSDDFSAVPIRVGLHNADHVTTVGQRHRATTIVAEGGPVDPRPHGSLFGTLVRVDGTFGSD